MRSLPAAGLDRAVGGGGREASARTARGHDLREPPPASAGPGWLGDRVPIRRARCGCGYLVRCASARMACVSGKAPFFASLFTHSSTGFASPGASAGSGATSSTSSTTRRRCRSSVGSRMHDSSSICTASGSRSSTAAMIDRRLRHADLIIGCSDTSRIQDPRSLSSTRSALHDNLQRCRGRPAPGRQSRQHRGTEIRLLNVGRVSPEKGLHVLRRCAATASSASSSSACG